VRQSSTTRRVEKGKYLELRVARLLFAEGLSPFVNVYFHLDSDPRSVTSPDVDVMGCRLLPDATIFYAHYDCKSGDSEVISRILKLLGLRNRIPPGPIMYVRQKTALDVKRYALQYGIRVCNTSQFQQRERDFVAPIFGENFPSICDARVHEVWLSTKGRTRDKRLGRILKYFDYEFWAEEPFSRLRRSIAAAELIQQACCEMGVSQSDQALLVGCVIRFCLFSLLAATSKISCLTDAEITLAVRDWLVSEKLSVSELQGIVESAAQLTFEIYGDPTKGPIRQSDYYVPPPDYTEELINLLRRTIELYDSLPFVIPAYDALIMEGSLLGRKDLANALMRGATCAQVERLKGWLMSFRLFLSSRQPSLGAWKGWHLISSGATTTEINMSQKLFDG
jgi:hypothetical protein